MADPFSAYLCFPPFSLAPPPPAADTGLRHRNVSSFTHRALHRRDDKCLVFLDVLCLAGNQSIGFLQRSSFARCTCFNPTRRAAPHVWYVGGMGRKSSRDGAKKGPERVCPGL